MTKVSLVIQNHLNLALIEMHIQQEVYQQQTQDSLQFVKYLVHRFPNTTVKIDADEVYNQFKLDHAK